MDPTTNAKGIALLCDAQGIIQKIVHDDFALTEARLLGNSVTRLAIPASVGKLLNFLNKLKDETAVFNWEINCQFGNEVEPLHLAGANFNEALLIVGAKTNDRLESLYDELMKIHNEQATLFRATSKAKIELSMAGKREQDIYDQLTQLNNELANLQRELTQKTWRLNVSTRKKTNFLAWQHMICEIPLG
ncbi:MAG: hypothetical protein IPM76_24495 [Chloroflexi bacterium]|nr:hypothetical protein [Chloroflexota bacterium]